nr:MAG TPA: hypothetical protein [Caudoviricetes sp.]
MTICFESFLIYHITCPRSFRTARESLAFADV